MGKIRIKTFGDEEQEQKDKEKLERKKQAKLSAAKSASGERAGKKVVETQIQENVIEPQAEAKTISEEVREEEKPKAQRTKKDKFIKEKKSSHSQNYQNLLQLVDRAKNYTLSEALELLGKLQRGKFDETVELHLNTLSAGVSGNITLPHGTGKKTRVAIASDSIISEIEKGIINFDILISEPSMMSKLARVAKILGPKGLMPNPKNGTITEKVEEVVKKYEGGLVNFKTEIKSPIMHLTVGKMSFGKEKLSQNIESIISAVKKSNIVNATLKSTMSPGVKLKI